MRRRSVETSDASRKRCQESRRCNCTLASAVLNCLAFVPLVLSSRLRYPCHQEVSTVRTIHVDNVNSRGISFGALPFGLRVRGGYQSSDEYDLDEDVAFRVSCVANFDEANVDRLLSIDIDRLLSLSSGNEKELKSAEGSSSDDKAEGRSSSDGVASILTERPDASDTSDTTSRPIDVDKLVFGASRHGDGSESDPDGIPARFLRMQKGNRQHAKDAFVSTVQWRLENKVDTILSRAHPRFDVCKAIFPHYFAGRDPSGNPIVVQRPGGLNFDLAHEKHISMDDLLFHYVFVLEYCWNILEPGPDGIMTSVVDMVGVGFRQVINGEMRDFIQKSIGVISENYPQRSFRTLVINAPGWFGRLFKIIKPLLRESTRDKIAIFNASPEQDKALAQYLGQESLPAELLVGGGTAQKGNDAEFEPGPRSRIEHELREFVLAVLKARGEEMEKV